MVISIHSAEFTLKQVGVIGITLEISTVLKIFLVKDIGLLNLDEI